MPRADRARAAKRRTTGGRGLDADRGATQLKRVQARAPGIPHPVWLRQGSSDEKVFEEVLQQGEYRLELPRPPATIVDAGANIGLSAVFFANAWPQARILAIEPDAGNFALLLDNVRPYPNIVPAKAALWARDVALAVLDPGEGHWALRVGEAAMPGALPEVGAAPGLSLVSLMNLHDMDFVDLLKLDIEGAEHALFAAPTPWLELVGNLIAEVHPQSGDVADTGAIEAALAGFELEVSCEKWCFPKLRATNPGWLARS